MSSLININALLNLFEKLMSQYRRKLYQILPLKKGKNKKIKKKTQQIRFKIHKGIYAHHCSLC